MYSNISASSVNWWAIYINVYKINKNCEVILYWKLEINILAM